MHIADPNFGSGQTQGFRANHAVSGAYVATTTPLSPPLQDLSTHFIFVHLTLGSGVSVRHKQTKAWKGKVKQTGHLGI